ncbi:peroxidase TAP [Gymnopilus junonius]|uniref:Peroxidase TAP n=1 Tax=Gymnopilus junonius TaxID=109634 RepID=A0A9P5NS39_GYMJU|nr:peroxidase TAP [Gymnopilus junonius]
MSTATTTQATPVTPLDLNNIQGDILSGLPKKTQIYYFFEITDATKFRHDLRKFIPLVETVAGVLKDRDAIDNHKKNKHPGLIPMTGVNISFSHKGFVKLGIDDSTLAPAVDKAFKTGQQIDAVNNLGDPKKSDGSPDWDSHFLQDIHGMFIISGDCHNSIKKKEHEIEQLFGVQTSQASIKKIVAIRGDVRPGAEAGHEHFGFLDGVSNPAVIGFDKVINPGPKPVEPGVLLTGQPGDSFTRAPWATDGSFIAFRYLFQQVPEFNEFLKQNPIAKDGNGNALTPEEGSELLGARMVGRWKSGAPIDLAPFKDDPVLAADQKRNNDFFFEGEINSQLRCPFATHVRKTNPRNDLEVPPPGIAPIPIEGRRIMRRGIQFGPELTKEEKAKGKTEHGRGLLFASYQTNITNGFQFLQQSWANTQNFPPFETQPELPGLDPLIGQGVRSMSGLDPLAEQKVLSMPTFIVPRGGEYFFAPSLKGLKETIAAAA